MYGMEVRFVDVYSTANNAGAAESSFPQVGNLQLVSDNIQRLLVRYRDGG